MRQRGKGAILELETATEKVYCHRVTSFGWWGSRTEWGWICLESWGQPIGLTSPHSSSGPMHRLDTIDLNDIFATWVHTLKAHGPRHCLKKEVGLSDQISCGKSHKPLVPKSHQSLQSSAKFMFNYTLCISRHFPTDCVIGCCQIINKKWKLGDKTWLSMVFIAIKMSYAN